MSFTSVTLTGTYVNPDGSVPIGLISFTLDAEMLQAGVGVVPRTTKIAVLDNTGHFSISLYANNDALTTPAGVLYNVIEAIEGAVLNEYAILLPNSPTTNDISDLIPLPVINVPLPVGGIAFEAAVRLNSLDQMASAAAAISMGNNRIMSLLTGIMPTDAATVAQSNSWNTDVNTWTFVTGVPWEFSLSGNFTSTYLKGTKVAWKESGVQKYGVVQSSGFLYGVTAVFLIPTSDYLMAAAPDAFSQQYSYGNPPGFPTEFAYPGQTTQSTTTTGGSANATLSAANPNIRVGMEVTGTGIPAGVTVSAVSGTALTLSTGSGVSGGTNTLTFNIIAGFSAAPFPLGWWSVRNGACTLNVYCFSNGTSNSTVASVLAPIAAGTALGGLPGTAIDNGTLQGAVLSMATGSLNRVSVALYPAPFTASGTKGVGMLLTYPI